MKKVEIVICKRCVMDTTDPDITFDENGLCNYCNRYFNVYKKKYPMDDAKGKSYIDDLVEKIKIKRKGESI